MLSKIIEWFKIQMELIKIDNLIDGFKLKNNNDYILKKLFDKKIDKRLELKRLFKQ